MSKFLMLTLVACGGLLLVADQSQAGRRGCCCGGGYAAPPAVVAPAPPATAAAPQAYRSYSYEPQTSSGYSNSFLRNWGGHAYESAINKSLGRVN
jgi:hypothetical protein